jgi:hypothetical protein
MKGPQAVPSRHSGEGGLEMRKMYLDVKKVDVKGGAGG